MVEEVRAPFFEEGGDKRVMYGGNREGEDKVVNVRRVTGRRDEEVNG